MRRLILILVSTLAVLVSAAVVHAQDILVPAGTLLQCTMDEPNFSSKTAAIGDPVLCHLRTMQEFGRPVFPRVFVPFQRGLRVRGTGATAMS